MNAPVEYPVRQGIDEHFLNRVPLPPYAQEAHRLARLLQACDGVFVKRVFRKRTVRPVTQRDVLDFRHFESVEEDLLKLRRALQDLQYALGIDVSQMRFDV